MPSRMPERPLGVDTSTSSTLIACKISGLTPRPTVTALLSGDAAVISARKHEISPERTAEQMKCLSVLSGSRGVLDLDAQKPLDENVEAVLRRLFPHWSEAR